MIIIMTKGKKKMEMVGIVINAGETGLHTYTLYIILYTHTYT